jgi:hypothetical protein
MWNGRFMVSASCVTISTSNVHLSSETQVYTGVRSRTLESGSGFSFSKSNVNKDQFVLTIFQSESPWQFHTPTSTGCWIVSNHDFSNEKLKTAEVFWNLIWVQHDLHALNSTPKWRPVCKWQKGTRNLVLSHFQIQKNGNDCTLGANYGRKFSHMRWSR